jgi:hypothetical protein
MITGRLAAILPVGTPIPAADPPAWRAKFQVECALEKALPKGIAVVLVVDVPSHAV